MLEEPQLMVKMWLSGVIAVPFSVISKGWRFRLKADAGLMAKRTSYPNRDNDLGAWPPAQ
ncbi:MAG: hypothetical protein ACLP2P_07860 [Desulfobaccales bacterium]